LGSPSESQWDLPRGWRGPTLDGSLAALPTLRFVEELCEKHGQRVAELIATIRAAHHRPGVMSVLTIRVRRDSSERTVERRFRASFEIGEASSLTDALVERSEGTDSLLGDAISLIDECFELIASSRLAAAKVVSTISAAYRLQAVLLRTLHELGAVDRTALASYTDRLKYDFNAAKLQLAQHWLEHGRDEVDIGKVTKKLYRDVLGASDVAAEVAEIVDSARDSGRLGRHSPTGDPVFVKVGPNGRVFVQLGRRSDPRPKRALRIELPDRVEYAPSDTQRVTCRSSSMPGDPRDIALDQASKLIDERLRRIERDRPLGVHPATGQNVYAKDGRWGGFVQLGERKRNGPRPKIVSIPDGATPEDVDFKGALDLLDQVVLRSLGDHPEQGLSVTLQTDGRWGPFVSCGAHHATIPERSDPMTVTLREAVRFLASREELRLWLSESSDAIRAAISPSRDVLTSPGDAGSIERRPMVAGSDEWLSRQTEAERTRMLDRLERIRILRERVPREAHLRGDIGTDDLARWIGSLEAQWQADRQFVLSPDRAMTVSQARQQRDNIYRA